MDVAVDSTAHHFSALLSRMLIEKVRGAVGEDATDVMLVRAGLGLSVARLTDDREWLSYGQFRCLLEAAALALGSPRALAASVDDFELDAGTMPDRYGSILALGSLESLLAEVGDGNMGTSTIHSPCFTTQVGLSTWNIAGRLDDEFEPFEELCEFMMGLGATMPRLFGFTGVHTEEVTCQRRGDSWCTVRLSWQVEGGDAQSARFLRTQLTVAERRLDAFQETVAKVVGGGDLADTMGRIAVAAGNSVPVPQFVLALDPLPWPTQLVYGVGLNEADSTAVAARKPAQDDLVVDIVSSGVRHGRLIALGAADLVQESMRAQVQAYAQLAATALDGVLAVEDARRQAATAKLLLELAMSLARIGSVKELADRLVEVVPALLSCDRATFALVDDDDARSTVIAMEGFDPQVVHSKLGTSVSNASLVDHSIVYATAANSIRFGPEVAEATRSSGCVALVSVPIEVGGKVSAWLTADVIVDPSRLSPSKDLEGRLLGLAAQASTAMLNAQLLERVSHQADHDVLTGLANRKVFVDQLGADPQVASVLFVDLDDFKDVNDGLGHHAGDLLLCQVAGRLTAAVRDGDMVARLGGDEFAIIVSDPKPGAARHVARRVIEAFDMPFNVAGHEVSVSASVGLASHSDAEGDLLRNADVAMYRAKAAGKGRLAMFEPGMDHAASERLALHADLAQAIGAGQLRLLYQPVFDLGDGTVRAGEALVRWQRPTLGLLTPDRFISLAEETGLIASLGAWVLAAACDQAASWPAHLAVAVNVSPRQLEHDSFIDKITECLQRSHLTPSRLILEITESVLARDIAAMIPRLQKIRNTGVRIAIDDFGTGYSSLGVLVDLPVDILKIDRGFISQMCNRSGAADLVQVLIDMGRTLGLEVIAEGIEQPNQLKAFQQHQCPLGQGFLYSPPSQPAASSAYCRTAPPRRKIPKRTPPSHPSDMSIPAAAGSWGVRIRLRRANSADRSRGWPGPARTPGRS